MRFTKMHGAGNDYVFIDCFQERLPPDIPALARAVSDRHRGIGADGLILICPSEQADARMRMWNADGTPGEMCGNGIRCVAKYLYDHGLARRSPLTVETDVGMRRLDLEIRNAKVEQVRVEMGTPRFSNAEIPTTLPGSPPVEAELWLIDADSAGSGRRSAVTGAVGQQRVVVSGHSPRQSACAADGSVRVTCLSMGNPHCVVFVDEPSDEWVRGVGPTIETHPAFPQQVNVEFVQVVSAAEVRMRVWERGTGETLACGTGACAATVAGVLTGRTSRSVLCRLPGGQLQVEWSEEGPVFLTGPAVEVFQGELTTDC